MANNRRDRKKLKKRSPTAAVLADKLFRQRKINSKKVYNRKKEHDDDNADD